VKRYAEDKHRILEGIVQQERDYGGALSTVVLDARELRNAFI
jgi:hypothetical protein